MAIGCSRLKMMEVVYAMQRILHRVMTEGVRREAWETEEGEDWKGLERAKANCETAEEK